MSSRTQTPRPEVGFPSADSHEVLLEGHATLLDIRRDRVDDGVGSRNGGGDRGLIAHIGGDDRDPIETDRLQSIRAWSGCRTATRTVIPCAARRSTNRRPKKPPPPNTTTMVIICSGKQGAGQRTPVEVAVGTDLLRIA